MPLRQQLSDAFGHIQAQLFPRLREEIGPLTADHERIVTVLGMISIETHVRTGTGGPGRPPEDRQALARAFVAKAVLGLTETSKLMERLKVDARLCRICGWEGPREVPSEATFSRAFAEFSEGDVAARIHKALIERTLGQQIVGHVAIDATAIEAREKPVKIEAPEAEVETEAAGAPEAAEAPEPKAETPKRKRGRPRKGEVRPPKALRRLERQATMSVRQMLADLPVHCSIGVKRNAKGHTTKWAGYKLHIATADGDIPVACVLTSAHVHDSQVAIPLMTMTDTRVDSLYDLMDSAYDAPEIAAHSRSLGHVPIIDHRARRGEKTMMETEARAKRKAGYRLAEDVRYNQRSAAERVNGRLKDDCGGYRLRVRGPAKVMCQLMLGILVITVEQLLRLVS